MFRSHSLESNKWYSTEWLGTYTRTRYIVKNADRINCSRNFSPETEDKYENLSNNSPFTGQDTNPGPLEQGTTKLTKLPLPSPILLNVVVWPVFDRYSNLNAAWHTNERIVHILLSSIVSCVQYPHLPCRVSPVVWGLIFAKFTKTPNINFHQNPVNVSSFVLYCYMAPESRNGGVRKDGHC
jgi:hypothetical protein